MPTQAPKTSRELAPGVHHIPTTPYDFVNSYVIADDDGSLTLIDAGLRWAPRRLLAGLAGLGKRPQDVTRIVLTHAHADHAGGVARMREESGAGVIVHERDAAYVEGGRMPPTGNRLTNSHVFLRVNGSFPPAPVAHSVIDGELLPIAGGLRVLHTPGHTPGHVSLLHEPTGVLITGDSIWNVRGLRWPLKALCTDFGLSQQTADRLGEADFEVAAFTHGSPVRTQARETVRRFLREARRVS
ncbi:MAG: MBL fold metallo-hydrolase [Frankiaceae bacterium]